MKSFILKMTLCIALLAQAAICNADSARDTVYLNSNPRIYVRGFGGLNLLHHTNWHHAKYRTNAGYVVGTAVGCRLRPLRIEGEFSYRSNDVSRLTIEALNVDVTGHLQQWCGFGNVLFEVPLKCCCLPYIGVGAGYRHIKPGVNFDERSDTSFQNFIDSANEWGIYQAMAGVNFTVSDMVNMQLGYCYVNGWTHDKCASHTLAVSAILQF